MSLVIVQIATVNHIFWGGGQKRQISFYLHVSLGPSFGLSWFLQVFYGYIICEQTERQYSPLILMDGCLRWQTWLPLSTNQMGQTFLHFTYPWNLCSHTSKSCIYFSNCCYSLSCWPHSSLLGMIYHLVDWFSQDVEIGKRRSRKSSEACPTIWLPTYWLCTHLSKWGWDWWGIKWSV